MTSRTSRIESYPSRTGTSHESRTRTPLLGVRYESIASQVEVAARVVPGSTEEVATQKVTPCAILQASEFGSLTRGGLRDALILAAHRRGMPCTAEDALLSVDVSLEAGIITGPDDDGLYRVAH